MIYEDLKEKIFKSVLYDQSQKEVMKSTHKRIIVEAPPGYGKTKLLLDKTIYNLLNNLPKNYEKVLMLTYSNNTVSKIRRDMEGKLDNYSSKFKEMINSKITITNYHGFASRVLQKYGYILDDRLKDIKLFKVINEEKLLEENYNEKLIKFKKYVNDALPESIFNHLREYNEIILNELLNNKMVTYNSIITLTIQLFEDQPQLLELYKKLYTKIVIDEFQDTNYLNLKLIDMMLHDNLYMELYGDPLQRIYGFIGTVDNIFDLFGEKNEFENFKLTKNYRFENNDFLLQLESRIRAYAMNPIQTYNRTSEMKNPNLFVFNTHEEESEFILKKINELGQKDINKKIAILTTQRGNGINRIKTKLQKNGIHYFDALEIDKESSDYKDYCNTCSESFYDYFIDKECILKDDLREWFKYIFEKYNHFSEQTRNLNKLLKAFLEAIVLDSYYRRLDKRGRFEFILSIFNEYNLIKYLSFIELPIQLLTVHTSKGLEWDYVILIDVEKDILPNYNGFCKNCIYRVTCDISEGRGFNDNYIEQLSVFYVAVTRAKKDLYITASKKNSYNANTNISCILKELKLIV